jgi:hypothetical protein
VIQSEDFGEIEVELAPPEAQRVEATEEPVQEEPETGAANPTQFTPPKDWPEERPSED